MNGRGNLQNDKALEGEVREVIERFRIGWEQLDAAQILSTLAQRDDMMMYGTDLAERWIGYDTLVDPTKAMVEAFNNPVYQWGEGQPLIWVRGDVGWACGELTINLIADGRRIEIVMRSTFVLARDDDEWKIAHAHFSVGQDEPVADYE